MTDDMEREPLQARIYLGEEITMAESAENIVRSHYGRVCGKYSQEPSRLGIEPYDALTGGDSCNRFLYYQLKMSMRCSRRNGFPARIRIF